MTHEPLRIDNRFRTGEPARRCLQGAIRFFKQRNAPFKRMGI